MIDYRVVFDQIPDASLLVDINNSFKILDSNDAFNRMFTIPSSEQSFQHDLLDPASQSIFLSALEIMKVQNVRSTDLLLLRSLVLEGQHRCKLQLSTREIYLLLFILVPVYREFHWIFTAVNASVGLLTCKLSQEEKALRETRPLSSHESELIDFFQHAPIGLHWLSGTGHVIWANDTELKELGYSAEEYIGHVVLEFCPEEETALNEVFEKLSHGETIRNAPFKFRAKNGEARYLTVDSNVSWHPDGTFKHTRCFIRNDTERRIRDAVNESTINQAKQLAQSKDNFIRRIFHEIRTPMHVVSTCFQSQVITKDDVREMSDQVQGCLDLLEELTYATMFERGKLLVLRPRRVDLRENIASMIQRLKKRHPSVDVEVYMDERLTRKISVDLCLFRALMNLLSNAADLAGEVPMALHVCGDRSSVPSNLLLDKDCNFFIRMEISTIKPADAVDINRSFQSYYSVSASENAFFNDVIPEQSSKAPGKLGYYNSFNIIQNLGGNLDVLATESSLAFHFGVRVELISDDLSSEDSVEGSPNPSPSSFISAAESTLASRHVELSELLPTQVKLNMMTDRKRRVLVVDDSPICRRVLAKVLDSAGYDIDMASNGQEACEKLSFEPCLFDAVLMDLRMPVMDGLEATRYDSLSMNEMIL